MKKEKKEQGKPEEKNNTSQETIETTEKWADVQTPEKPCDCKNEEDAANKELEEVKQQLNDKSKQCEDYLEKLQRIAAEFDNYKKRTSKEKESIYSDAVSDVVTAFLPVMDSLDRALSTCADIEGDHAIKEGLELVKRQALNALKSLEVEEIKSVGEVFDPNLHNAVMHIDDEAYGQNTIVEEFQKGYIYKDKVIRYSMVKVAN